MKKILAILLILTLCLAFTIPVAFAAEIDTTEPIDTENTENTDGEPTEQEKVSFKESLILILKTSPAGQFLLDIFGVESNENKLMDKITELLGSIIDVFSAIKSKFSGDFMQPVVDFINSISKTAVALFAPFWDFPIIKDLLILTAALGVLGGLFSLFVR